MAITMQTADRSMEVQLPPEAAHKKWLEWTGKGGPGMPQGSQEPVSGDQVGAGLESVEQGMANFEPAGSGATRVHMQLRFNESAMQEHKLEPDWMHRRMDQYLERFKNFAEGKPA